MESQPLLREKIAAKAEFIVNNLQQTDYTHAENINPDLGIYDCDCSGFVDFVLESVAPHHYAMIPKEANQPRPRAFEYNNFFRSLTTEPTDGWQRILFLRDVRRGDIIAWRFKKIEEGYDTGHVLIVSEMPIKIDDSIFAIQGYDSAAKPHFDDTRVNEKGEFKSGVGSGIIKFKVDDSDGPVAFQFTPSEDFKTLSFAIAIGQIIPFS
jgi:hypothetical protein